MKTISLTLKIVFICFFMVLCSKDEDDGIHLAPKIEWIPGSATTTYTYYNGVVSGYYFDVDFKVIANYGQICLEVHNEGGNGVTCNSYTYVNSDKNYRIRVKGKITSSRIVTAESECLSIVFCSLNCIENQEIPVEPYLVEGAELIDDKYYCPNSVDLIDLVVTEIE